MPSAGSGSMAEKAASGRRTAASSAGDAGVSSGIPLLTANGQAGKRADDGILDSILHRKNFLTQACLVRVMATLLPEAASIVGAKTLSDSPVLDFGPEHVIVLGNGAWDARASELMPEREFEDAVAESPTLRMTEPARRVSDAQALVRSASAAAPSGVPAPLELEIARAELAAARDFQDRMAAVEASRLRPSTLRCSAGRDATGAAILTTVDQRVSVPSSGACTVVPPERRAGGGGNEASVVFCLGSVLHALAFVGARDRRTHVPPPSSPMAAVLRACRAGRPGDRPTLEETARHPSLAVAHHFLGLPSQDAFASLVGSLASGAADPSDRWWRRVVNPPRPGQPVPVGKIGGRHKAAPPPRPEFGAVSPPRGRAAAPTGASTSSSSAQSDGPTLARPFPTLSSPVAAAPSALPASVLAYAPSQQALGPAFSAASAAAGGAGARGGCAATGSASAARRSRRVRSKTGPWHPSADGGDSPQAPGRPGAGAGVPRRPEPDALDAYDPLDDDEDEDYDGGRVVGVPTPRASAARGAGGAFAAPSSLSSSSAISSALAPGSSHPTLGPIKVPMHGMEARSASGASLSASPVPLTAAQASAWASPLPFGHGHGASSCLAADVARLMPTASPDPDFDPRFAVSGSPKAPPATHCCDDPAWRDAPPGAGPARAPKRWREAEHEEPVTPVAVPGWGAGLARVGSGVALTGFARRSSAAASVAASMRPRLERFGAGSGFEAAAAGSAESDDEADTDDVVSGGPSSSALGPDDEGASVHGLAAPGVLWHQQSVESEW